MSDDFVRYKRLIFLIFFFECVFSQAQGSSEFRAYPHGDFPMNPVYYPALVHGLNPLQYEEQTNRGAGIYAVPFHTFSGHVAGLASNNLIPLTYNIPTYVKSLLIAFIAQNAAFFKCDLFIHGREHCFHRIVAKGN